MGTLQFVLGATAGALVGELGNTTAIPFGAVIAGCGLGAFLTYRTLPAVTDVRPPVTPAVSHTSPTENVL
jgi:hypothetical protein